MANLVSAELKSSILSAIDDIHDTFSRAITIINEVANVEVIDNDNYNFFSDKKDPNITYTANSTVILARIKYLDKAEAAAELVFPGRGGDQSGGTATPLTQNFGVIRIKVKNEYTDLVAGATKILVDDQECQLALNYTPQTWIDKNYTVFYLLRQR